MLTYPCQSKDMLTEMWGGMEGGILVIVATINTAEGNAAAVGELDVVPVIIDMLETFYGDNALPPLLSSDVNSFPRFAGDRWKQFNLILVGGPLTNSYTQEVLQDIRGLKCSFLPGQHAVQVPGISREETQFRKKEGGFIERDWGLFYRMPSPYATGRRIYILAGCTTQGTAAVASASVIESLIPSLLASAGIPGQPPVWEAAVVVSRDMQEDHVRRAIQVRYPQPSIEECNPHALRAAKQSLRERRGTAVEDDAVFEVDLPKQAIDEIYTSFETFRDEMKNVIKL